jgi:hypothetical protein
MPIIGRAIGESLMVHSKFGEPLAHSNFWFLDVYNG